MEKRSNDDGFFLFTGLTFNVRSCVGNIFCSRRSVENLRTRSLISGEARDVSAGLLRSFLSNSSPSRELKLDFFFEALLYILPLPIHLVVR